MEGGWRVEGGWGGGLTLATKKFRGSKGVS